MWSKLAAQLRRPPEGNDASLVTNQYGPKSASRNSFPTGPLGGGGGLLIRLRLVRIQGREPNNSNVATVSTLCGQHAQDAKFHYVGYIAVT